MTNCTPNEVIDILLVLREWHIQELQECFTFLCWSSPPKLSTGYKYWKEISSKSTSWRRRQQNRNINNNMYCGRKL